MENLDPWDKDIIQKRKNGMSAEKIALKYGVSRALIEKKLDKSKKHLGLSSQEIAKAYKSGKSIYDIAKLYGCSPTTVYYHLKKLNVKMRPRSWQKKKKKKRKPKKKRKLTTPLEVRRKELRKRKEAFIDFIIEVIEGMRKKRREGA